MPHVAILTSLDRLPPLDGDPGTYLDFAVQVSATYAVDGVEEPPATAEAVEFNHLLPWKWGPLEVRFFWTDGSLDLTDPNDPRLKVNQIYHSQPILSEPVEQCFPGWTQSERTALRHQASRFVREDARLRISDPQQPDATQRPLDPMTFYWKVSSLVNPDQDLPAKGDTPFEFRHLVGISLANQPAPIPYLLNLAHCVRVPLADLAAVPESPEDDADPAGRRCAIFAVVNQRPGTDGADLPPPGLSLPDAPVVRPYPKSADAIAPKKVGKTPLTVEYAPVPGEIPRQAWANAHYFSLPSLKPAPAPTPTPTPAPTPIPTPPPTPAPPSSAPLVDGQLDPQTLWVYHGIPTSTNVDSAEDLSEDWQSFLRPRLGEQFDLAQFLIDRLRLATDSLQGNLPDLKAPVLDPVDPALAALVVGLARRMATSPRVGRWFAQVIPAVTRDLCGLGWNFTPNHADPTQSWLANLVQHRLEEEDMNASGPSLQQRWVATNLVAQFLPWDRTHFLESNAKERWFDYLTQLPGEPGATAKGLRTSFNEFFDRSAWKVTDAQWSSDVAAVRSEWRELLKLLERWQTFVAEPTTLRAAIAKQWNDACAACALPPPDKDRLLRVLGEALTAIQPRAGMESGLLERFLARILQESAPGLPRQLGHAIELYVTTRLTVTADEAGMSALPSLAAADAGDLVVNLGQQAVAVGIKTAYERIVPAEMKELRRQDMDAHSLIWQTARLGAFTDPRQPPAGGQLPTPITADPDLQRALSGYGVLLRDTRAGNGAWRCLSLARVYDATGRNLVSNQGVVLVPRRLVYSRDLTEACLNYDEDPIGPESLHSAAPARREDVTPPPPFLRFRAMSVSDHDIATIPDALNLPKLIFGHTFELASFGVTNTGLPPQALTRWKDGFTRHPASLSLPYTADLPVVPLKAKHCCRYWRRVPIGPVRFAARQGSPASERMLVPEFPADVRPLGTELPEPLDADLFRPPRPKGALPGPDRLPLVLLWPKKWSSGRQSDQFTFDLRRPATTLRCWTRWRRGDAGNESEIEKEIDAVSAHVLAGRRFSKSFDESLDDPAVDGLARVELRARYLPKVGVVEPVLPGDRLLQAMVPWPAATADKNHPLQAHQAPHVTVTVTELSEPTDFAGPVEKASLKIVGSTVQVSIPAGSVWELRVYARVRKDLFDPASAGGRFLPSRRALSCGSDADTFYFKPFRLLLEAATDAYLPTPEEVWSWLRPGFDNSLMLRLDAAQDKGLKLDWVKNVVVQQQRWRWNGQPVPPFPFASVSGSTIDTALEPFQAPAQGQQPPNPTTCRMWEVQGFGDRGDEDHARTSTELKLPWSRDTSHSDVNASLWQTLYSQELPDGRAMLVRFSAELHSRYGSLQESVGRFIQAFSAPNKTRWRRVIVRARLTKLPRPAVKLIVPLTQGLTPDFASKPPARYTPGVLAVLHGPWYDHAGLAEELQAEILTLDKIPVAGEDPTLDPGMPSGAPLGGLGASTVGPFGYSFDPRGVASPSLVHSSFRVTLETDARKLPAWFMARLQFRRRTSPGGTGGLASLRSKPSAPVWTQFLPDAWQLIHEDVLKEAVGTKDLAPVKLPPFKAGNQTTAEPVRKKFLCEAASRPRFLEGRTHPVTGKNSAGRAAGFLYWMVLTRKIADAAGAVSEIYLATLEHWDAPTGEQYWFASDPADVKSPPASSAEDTVSGFLRLAQIQVSDLDEARQHLQMLRKAGGDRTIWELFFPAEPVAEAGHDIQLPDCVARITMISPAIPFTFAPA